MEMRKVGGISDLMIDIQEHVDAGELTFEQIAEKFDVPIEWVRSAEESSLGD